MFKKQHHEENEWRSGRGKAGGMKGIGERKESKRVYEGTEGA